jgi:hypothetical protein
MSKPEGTARRGRPSRSATVSQFKMTAVDIDRIARTVETKLHERTLREAYLVHSATYYAVRGSSGDGSVKTVVLVPAKERPSFAQFRYWVSKIVRAGKP